MIFFKGNKLTDIMGSYWNFIYNIFCNIIFSIGIIIIFTILLFVLAVKFNWKENVVSEIDNRMLTNNPFESDEEFEAGEFAEALEDYAQDRIDYRDEMIYLYTLANDKLFGEMVHPSYIYGKDGYVFLLPSHPPEFNDYHIDFIDMIKKYRITVMKEMFHFYLCLIRLKVQYCKKN